jgi:hypothetical protein
MAFAHTVEPLKITAGTTVRWTRTLQDYPAPDWVLKYAILPQSGSGHVDVISTASNTSHAIEISSTATAAIAAGPYSLIGYVENGDQREKVYVGNLLVEPDPVSATSYDGRCWEEIQIAAIEESLAGSLRAEWSTISVGGKNLTRMTITEKLDARDRLKGGLYIKKHSRTGGIRTVLAEFPPQANQFPTQNLLRFAP